MSDMSYYADDEHWRAHAMRASEPPNQGFMPRWTRGTPGTHEPGLLWSNEYSYAYLKQGDHISNYRGNINSNLPSTTPSVRRGINDCTLKTGNPAGCQFNTLRNLDLDRSPLHSEYNQSFHVMPNGRR